MDNLYLENIQRRLGKRINKLRIHAGYKTQLDLAIAYSGSKSPWISMLEGGKESPTFYTLVKLANTLQIPMHNLMDLSGKSPIVMGNKYNLDLATRIKLEKQALGTNLLKSRKRQKKSLLDIEVASGISLNNISKYELGKVGPNFITIVILCGGLQIPLLELFPL